MEQQKDSLVKFFYLGGFTLAEGGHSPLLCGDEGVAEGYSCVETKGHKFHHTSQSSSPRLEKHVFSHYKKGFTLAEVLITLGVIGVVAAVTLTSIKHIRYSGYAEAFLKTYSELQQAHLAVVQKYSDPQNWPFTDYYSSSDNSGNAQIVSWFMDEFQPVKRCSGGWSANECRGDTRVDKVKFLNSTDTTNNLREDMCSSMVLKDGRYIAIGFSHNFAGVLWGFPKMFFMVDVNGRFKKPNQIGRDIFYIAFEQNPQKKYVIRPFYKTSTSGGPLVTDTCNLESTGMSCGDRILKEKGMKY